jgi:putative peptidoglycan lipid II flippase
MLVTLVSVLVNAAGAYTMVKILHFGHAGLALSLSLVSIFNMLALLALIRSRIGGIRLPEIAFSFAKIAVASAAMGLVCLLIVQTLHSRVLHVILGIPAGAAAFYAVASALHVPELAETRETVLRKLRRRG